MLSRGSDCCLMNFVATQQAQDCRRDATPDPAIASNNPYGCKFRGRLNPSGIPFSHRKCPHSQCWTLRPPHQPHGTLHPTTSHSERTNTKKRSITSLGAGGNIKARWPTKCTRERLFNIQLLKTKKDEYPIHILSRLQLPPPHHRSPLSHTLTRGLNEEGQTPVSLSSKWSGNEWETTYQEKACKIITTFPYLRLYLFWMLHDFPDPITMDCKEDEFS